MNASQKRCGPDTRQRIEAGKHNHRSQNSTAGGSTTIVVPKLTGNRCQCAGCGDYFNSTSTFDRHRAGAYDTRTSRRCLSPAELILRGWSRNGGGFWIERAMRREASTARHQSHCEAGPLGQ